MAGNGTDENLERDPTASGAVRTDVPLPSGPRLDEFECRRRIGQGGMGDLWEAYDHALERIVALKLLPRGALANEREIARFQREAVALARVRHEGVVAIFKAGSDQGLYYIAEELVAGGRTLRDEMEDWRSRGEAPDPRRLAELFARIAQALAAAHEAGVVHRDVKPTNILITPDGRPKVADFGVARLEDDLSLSRSGEFTGTYFYASPEQVRPDGRAVDARSDVFSLGATLYEGLAWRRPFEGDNVQAVIDAITRDDPPDPRRVRASVPADLALIAMKALEKRREARHGSMRELEHDLGRFLAHEPILAKAPSLVRRGQKWMLRHPTASATIGLSVLAFAGLLALTLRAEHLRRTAERAESAARTEAALSREVEAFLTGLFASASPDLYGIEDLTLRDVVERGHARLQAGEVEHPEVRARLSTTLADVLAKLGAFVESNELLAEAANTWKELGLEAEPPAQATSFAQGVAAFDAGRDPEAIAILEELHALRLEGRLDRAIAWNVEHMRGRVLSRQGRFEEAETAFVEAEQLLRALHQPSSDELMALRVRRAESLFEQQRYADAEKLLAEDTARLEPLLESGNGIILDHFNLLALVWQGQRRLKARALFERVVAAADEHLGKNHARSIAFRINLATALEQHGELEAAETLFAEAWDASEARYGRTSPQACVTRNNLANCLVRQGRHDEAEAILRELVADMETSQGEHHPLTVRARTGLAYCVMGLGRSADAAELLERVLADTPPDAAERPVMESTLVILRRKAAAGR